MLNKAISSPLLIMICYYLGQRLDAFQLFHFHSYLGFNLSCLCNGIQSAIYWMNIYEGSDEEADSEHVYDSLETTRVWPLINMQPS